MLAFTRNSQNFLTKALPRLEVHTRRTPILTQDYLSQITESVFTFQVREETEVCWALPLQAWKILAERPQYFSFHSEIQSDSSSIQSTIKKMYKNIYNMILATEQKYFFQKKNNIL